MFNIIEMLFPVIFILIFIMIIFIFIKGIATWHKDNNSPRLTVSAKIVAKRQNTTHHGNPDADCKEPPNRHFCGGTCDQGGRGGRPKGIGAYGGYGALF